MKIIRFILAGILFQGFVQAQQIISPEDLDQISYTLGNFVEGINKKDYEKMRQAFTKDDAKLISAVQQKAMSLTLYGLALKSGECWQEIEPGKKVRFNCIYKEESPCTKISGLSTYFVFEKSGDRWFIVDTDFHKEILFFTWPWILFWAILVLGMIFFGLWRLNRNKK